MGFFDKVRELFRPSRGEPSAPEAVDQLTDRGAPPETSAPVPGPADGQPSRDDIAAELADAAGEGVTGAPGTESAQRPSAHTVVRGDTLETIAERYGVAHDELVGHNDIDNPDLIYAGQVIRIPPA